MASSLPTMEQVLQGFKHRRTEPLWRWLPAERKVTPRTVTFDDATGVERDWLSSVLSLNKSLTVYEQLVHCIADDMLFEFGKSDLLPPKIRVEGVEDFELHADTTPAADGILLTYSEGFDIFLLGFIAPVASLFRKRGSGSATLPVQHVADRLAYQLGWVTSIAKRPQGISIDPDAEQRKVADDLLTATKRFVLAHEIAHIVLGHFSTSPKDGPELGDNDVVTTSEPWKRELQADEYGLRLLLSASTPCELDSLLICAAPVILFRAQKLVEQFGAGSPGETHPSAGHRLSVLQNGPQLRSLPDQVTNFAGQVGRMLDDIEKKVLPLSPTAKIRGDQTREQVCRHDFHQLLDSSSDGFVDTEQFVNEARTLLRNYPSTLLAASKEVLDEARRVLRSEQNNARAHWAERRQRLIAMFAATLPADVREVIGVDPG
jgi:hypothetical protein